jgi:hypothetical protein
VVDTAFVGRLPGSENLAGLAVATSVFTFTFLLFNFLSTVRAPPRALLLVTALFVCVFVCHRSVCVCSQPLLQRR